MKSWYTIYPESTNVHLIKDCGMIPYCMYRYYNYKSYYITYNNDDYTYSANMVNGLKLIYLKKTTGSSLIDGCLFILKNYKHIDVLHMFHISKRSIAWAFLLKKLNKKCVTYIKSDYTGKVLFQNGKLVKLKKYFLKYIDIISSESENTCKLIQKKENINFEYIQNGFFDTGVREPISQKENVILTVARIGAPEKEHQLMLNGFAEIADKIPDWKLILVGSINEKNFVVFLSEYFKKYPELKDRVILLGEINNRDKLKSLYNSASIFTLTSSFEGFPIVFLEAAKSGCYILTSDIQCGIDFTRNGEYGKLFKSQNKDDFKEKLLSICLNKELLKNQFSRIQEYAYENYYWPKTCGKLNDLINKL